MAEAQATSAGAGASGGGGGGGSSTPASTPSSASSAPSTSSGGGSQAAPSSTAPSTAAAAAIQAKARQQQAGQTGGDSAAQPTGEQQTGQPQGPVDDATPPAVVADDDVARWLGSKGISVGDAFRDPEVSRVIKSYRELEGAHTKAQQKLRAMEEEQLRASTETPAPAEDISPVDALQKRYDDAVATQCALQGCANMAELRARAPGVFQAIQDAYNDEYRVALREEVKWERTKQAREDEKRDREMKLESDYQAMRAAMNSNLVALKEQDPNVHVNLVQSGMSTLITDIAKVLKVPPEWVFANEKWTKTLAEAASAVMRVRNMPKERDEWRKQHEAEIAKTAGVQSVATGDPLPGDAKAIMAKATKKKGSGNQF